MRIRRAIIIPAILSLSLAGSALAVTATSAAAAHINRSHEQVQLYVAGPHVYFHG
jgi:hypothetical protein